MKQLFTQYKPFFIFLLRFFVLYAVLTIGYRLYLNQYDEKTYELDLFTKSVAEQTTLALTFLGKNVSIAPNTFEPSMNLLYEGVFVARIVEGCNAVSVMVLFAAFVFAFSTQWLKTLGYIFTGCLIIHVLNVVRIALLAASLYYYPESEQLLHGVVFPLFIYGVVFALWVLWLQKFSGYAQHAHKK